MSDSIVSPRFMPHEKLPIQQYRSIVKEIILKIQKTVPAKKNKELIEVCRKAFDEIEIDTESCADKYYYIFKLGLETGLPRLVTDILSTIQKLYAYDFLNGDCEDNCIYADDRKPPAKNGRLPRKLIDAIVESVCECAQDQDNQVQLQVIKALLTLVIAVNSKVHESTLLIALKTQYSIFMTSTSQTNQKTAKAASTQMVNTVFSRMDLYMRHGVNMNPLDLRKIEGRLSSANLEKSLQKRRQEETKDDVSQQQSNDILRKSQPLELTFNALDLYVHGLVANIVDNVCLYEARVSEVKRLHNLSDVNTHQTDSSNQDTQNQSLLDAISKIPLNPIPTGKKECPDVSVKNELGLEAGRFGWCISCRQSANLWCKDTYHPVCSEQCKRKHIIEAGSVDRMGEDKVINVAKAAEAKLSLTDAHLVFRSIVKLSIGDGQNTQVNRFAMRTKIIGLELILTVLSAPKQSLLQKKEFIEVIKNTLCDGLLRYSVSQELVIFQLVVEIFYCLFLHFRKHLKQIIRVFIETIFLKILDSGNSSFQHKHAILTIFDKISRNSVMLLEIFVNFDCDIQQKDLTERIVESICKIANNHFAKTEHQNIISPAEALQLRNYAILILVQILRSFNATIETQIAGSKITERMFSKQNQGNDEQNNHSDSNPTISDAAERDSNLELQSQISAGDNKKSVGYLIGEIQTQRNVKQEMSKAAIKFNFKAKNGISFLVASKLIAPVDNFEQHVKDIVKFLKTTPALDKTQIGQFLGVDDKLQKACLYQFIDEFTLKGVDYVQSLKTILQGFRLPGEGQVVDRVMEKFGLKFIEDNPSGSDGCQGKMSAECVYLLSYATMMMQTSLHNPNAVKSRMTLEDFSKMIKGINAGENLQPEFVKKIYSTVEREPFTLNEDDDARLKAEASTATTYKRKQELFQKEGNSLVDRSKKEMGGISNQTYICVDDAGPIRPMFENTWSAFMAIFSMLLEKTNEDHIATLCIEGFTHSIKICGYFDLKTERDAFVSSFAKFTQVTNERKLQPKNIFCIQSLLDLATHQGNYLGESWFFVLECISRLEEMIQLGSGQVHDREFFDTQKSQKTPEKNSVTSQKSIKEANMAANSEIIVQKIQIEQIDQIFQNSLNLDQDAIINFIESLCTNSKNELKDQANPRKFSLQALVEIADLNMVRIRFVWAKLWEMLSKHFVWVGSHPNLMVAIFAIDSLRQLADKFLKREEFMSFNFQKDFLKPFEQIMLNNMHTRSDIKFFVITCIVNICATKTILIKSGWSVIINIFTLAAQDTEKQLVVQSFSALKAAINKHFDLLQGNFIELVNCLNKYSQNQIFNTEADEALDLLLFCAEKLQDNQLIDQFCTKSGLTLYQESLENMQRYVPQYGLIANQESYKEKNPIAGSIVVLEMEKSTVQDNKVPTPDKIRLSVLKAMWFPIMNSLTNLVLEKNQKRHSRAMNILFSILERAVVKTNLCFWQEILSQVFYPILEDINLAVQTQKSVESEGDNLFYFNVLEQLIERFGSFLLEYYDQLPSVSPIFVDILCLSIVNTKNARAAHVTVTSLSNFIQKVGIRLQPKEWDSMTTSICLCFEQTLPRGLLNEEVGNLQTLFTFCLVQLYLVDCVKETIQNYNINTGNIEQILACLEVSNHFCQEFNRKVDLRMNLWHKGFMKDVSTLPGLIAQEYRSLAAIIQIRFILFFREPVNDDQQLLKLCFKVLSEYLLKTRELTAIKQILQAEKERDEAKHLHEDELGRQITNLTPIVSIHILQNLNKMQDAQIRKNIKELGPILIDLTLCPDQEVRVANKEVLQRIFGMLV